MGKQKLKVGDIYTSTQSGDFILESVYSSERPNRYVIRFLLTGYTTIAFNSTIISGKVCDYLLPTVYGVACLGYAKVKDNLKAFRRWDAMISRCYNEKCTSYKYYGGVGVTVCERWKRYDYYLEDLPKLEGYNEILFNAGKLHLDKDKKQVGNKNKVYSPETCCFLSSAENNSFRELKSKSFIAYSPTGEVICVQDTSVRKFCIAYNLRPGDVASCLKKQKGHVSHLGWKFEYVKEITDENLRE
jgi:hypothetical protein